MATKQLNEQLLEKARKIRAIFFDVDGVLTDGGITYSNSLDEFKTFDVKDGAIIRPLREQGFIVGAITGRDSKIVAHRMAELKVDFVYQGVKNKFVKVLEVMDSYGLSWGEVSYVGDDMIDMNVIESAGLGFAPADAPEYVKEVADYVTKKSGGHGVLRELAELILVAQGRMEDVIAGYTKRK